MMSDIGNKIKAIRRKKGLSQEELADTAKLSLRTIQRIENNESEPRGASMNLICEVLEVSIEDILDYGKVADKNYLIFFHLSVLSFLIIPIGNIIIPLIIWINKKNKIIRLHKIGKNLLNYQIVWSSLIFILKSALVLFKIIHFENYSTLFYLLIGLYVINIVLPITFAIKIYYEKNQLLYPNLIRIIK